MGVSGVLLFLVEAPSLSLLSQQAEHKQAGL
jgi:hypothetical protein